LVSSVPIDEGMDDHEVEAFAVWMLLQGPEGRKLKHTKPKGYQNAHLHYDQHIKAAQDKQSKGPQAKPPSLSATLKDTAAFDPMAAVQLLAKSGIQAKLPAPPPEGAPPPSQ